MSDNFADELNLYLSEEQVAALEDRKKYLITQQGLPEAQRDDISVREHAMDVLEKGNQFAVDRAREAWQGKFAEPVPREGIAPHPLEGQGVYAEGSSRTAGMDEEARLEYEQMSEHPRHNANAAAKSGVDIHTGLPMSIRAKVSLLAHNPAAEAIALDSELRKMYREEGLNPPPETPLAFKEPNTGRMAYMRFDKETGKLVPTIADPVGIDTGDVADMFGGAVDMIGEVAGAIGGFMAGGPWGGVAGAGAGKGAAMGTREIIARGLGMDEDAIERAMVSDEYLTEMAMSAGFEALGPGVYGLNRLYQNKFRRVIEQADAPALHQMAADLKRDVEQLKASTDETFRPTLAQATLDPNIMVSQASLEAQAKGKMGEGLQRLTVANDQMLVRTAGKMFDGAGVSSPIHSADAVSSTARRAMREEEVVANDLVDSATKTVQDYSNELVTSHPGEDFFNLYRQNVAGAEQAMLREENMAWDMFRDLAGWSERTRKSGVMILNHQNSPVMKQLKDAFLERHTGYSQMNAQQVDAVLMDTINKMDGTGLDIVQDVSRRSLTEAELDPVLLHRAISQLKAEKRRIDNSVSTSGMSAQTLSKLIRAMDEMIVQGKYIDDKLGARLSGKEERALRGAYVDAGKATNQRIELFEQKAVQDMLETYKTKEGSREFLRNGAEIEAKLFKPGDASNLSRSLGALGRDPAIEEGLMNTLGKKFAQEVMSPPDGYSPARFDKFMERYEPHMKILMPEGTPNFIPNGAAFRRAQQDAMDGLKDIQAFLKDELGNSLKKTDASSIVTSALSDTTTPAQVAKMRSLMQSKHPALWNAVLSEGRETMMRDTFANPTAKGLEKLLRSESKLKVLYGPQFVDNLTSMKNIVKRVESTKAVKAQSEEGQNIFVRFFRLRFGPLSKPQRAITFAESAAMKMKRKFYAEALTDPASLDQLVKLSKMKFSSFRTWMAMEQLVGPGGFSELMRDPQLQGAYAEAMQREAKREEERKAAGRSQRAQGRATMLDTAKANRGVK